jgi:hypothetical protein
VTLYRPVIEPIDVDFEDLMKKAEVLAKSGLVREPLRNNPAAIVAVGLRGAELGVRLMTALDEIDVIDDRTSLSAQLVSALIRAAGHELRFTESTGERCVARGRRAEDCDDPNAWEQVEWTLDRAKAKGLLDEWVERKMPTGEGGEMRTERFTLGDERVDVPEWAQAAIRGGQLRRHDHWHRSPAEMLRARATVELGRMTFGDVLAGIAVEAYDEPGR